MPLPNQSAVSQAFMPHGMCYLWEPELLWTHVLADTLTWLSYWAIPPALIYLAVKARREVPADAGYVERALPFDWVFWAFGTFIVACGATHLMAIWTVWRPDYWVSGGVKVVTATASVATAIALPPMVPRVLEVIRDARTSEARRLELETANQELRELNRRLERSEEARARLVANVSHDLRTPLTLILGPIRELVESSRLAGEDRDLLGMAEANARVLLGQVNELLDIAHMEGGALPVRLAEADLANVVQEAAGNFRAMARAKDIELVVETPPTLPCFTDAKKVERIVLNLLANALRHTPPAGFVDCRLATYVVDGEDFARILVEDSGPGIPEEEQEEVFHRYRQGVSDDRGTSGLGLAIVRELADVLGGSVGVSTAEGGGARFEVLLRIRSEPVEDGTSAPAAASGAMSRALSLIASSEVHTEDVDGTAREPLGPEPEDAAGTILIVDDNRDLCRHLGRVLGEEHRVHLAFDGTAALEEANRLRPDLVLTDYAMPDMSGEELLRALRRDDALASIPVIVLTARADRELPARLLEAGASDYLTKPMEAAELKARVRNVLELTRTRRILEEETDDAGGRLHDLAREIGRQRRDLQRSVQEKQLVLQELHHRVKGNLQTVSSLLSIQRRAVADREAAGALDEARSRLLAIALVHEKLYGAGQPDSLAMADYLRGLADLTASSTWNEAHELTMDVRADPVTLPIDRAIPCALIAHELITNALRHGFPDGGPARLLLHFHREAEDANTLILRVGDDGVGYHAGGEDPDGVGWQLVEALSQQLGGTVRIGNGEGTMVEVRFPEVSS